jgi:ABC-type nitrate/sulfonate/bicarbonate transport system permease component
VTATVESGRGRGLLSPEREDRRGWVPSKGTARVVVLLVVIAFWQLFSGGPGSLLPSDAVGRPASVASAFGHLIANGQLFSGLGTTILSVLYSLLLGAFLGSLVGILTAIPVGRWVLDPIVTITYAIPKVGLIPLYIILLGIHTKTHVALGTSAVLFVYYFAVRDAAEHVDRDRVLALRLMGAGWLRVTWAEVIPSVVPQLLSATRIALPLGFATEIFAELQVPTSNGLGVSLSKFSANQAPNDAMALLIFVVAIAYLFDVVIGGWLRRYASLLGNEMDA